MAAAAHYRWQDGTLLLSCHLQPQASRDEFAGLHGDRIKIRIAAPPLEGRANTRLIEFLAAEFGVPKRSVRIVSGDSGRRKTVAIDQPARLPAALSIAPPAATL